VRSNKYLFLLTVELTDNINWTIILGLPLCNQVYCKNAKNYPFSLHFHLIFIFIEPFYIAIKQAKKNKKLFWVAAISPIVCIIVSTFSVYTTRADKDRVAIVSSI
jgi:hypothetical protein